MEKDELKELKNKLYRLKALQVLECIPFGVGSTVSITSAASWLLINEMPVSLPETAAYAALGIASYAVLEATTKKYNQTESKLKELNSNNKKL